MKANNMHISPYKFIFVKANDIQSDLNFRVQNNMICLHKTAIHLHIK